MATKIKIQEIIPGEEPATATTTFRLSVVGTKPLLVHNARMANPLDPYARALAALINDKKTSKTDDGRLAIIKTEARGAIYETEDGLAGLPLDNIYSCILEAARTFRRGADIERGLLYDPVVVPILIDSRTWKVEEYLALPEHIDYRPVRVQRSKTMRARPIFHNWAATCEFSLVGEIMDMRDLGPIIKRAGEFVGVCERHPRYGTFRWTVEVIS